MKSVLCFGDSLTWGYDPRSGTRYPFEERWPGILQGEFQGKARIIEEALDGRTVATDSWLLPDRSGRAMLAPLLETHAPLDVVIIMLGTNDCGPSYKLTAAEIAFGCVSLIWIVRKSQSGPGGSSPEILLVAPPTLGKLSPLMSLFFAGGESVSQALPGMFRTVAESNGCHFLDASEVVTASEADGVHLDPPEHRTLALAIRDVLAPLL
jgi:lysophospholipase L1-like esterase